MKYKVGVAGGAGILAFAVAFGIVWKSEAIRDAFQVERKYARLIFRDEGDGITSMSDYIAEIKVDGSPIPSYRSGDYIVAFVPFVAGPMKQQIQVSARFFNINTDQVRNKLELQNVPFQKSLVLAISTDDAGFDFPRMKPDQVVKLSNDELAGNPDDSQRVALGVDDHGTPPANDIPPAIVQAFQ